MRTRFSYISTFALTLALVFVVSGFVFPETGLANHCDPETQIHIEDGTSGGVCRPIGNQEGNDGGSFLSKIFGFAADALLAPFAWVSILILQITKLIFWISGVLLNHVIDFTVVKMAVNMDSGVINNAWSKIRDLANMTFIFVLLYAAIKTILGLGSDTKKLIINVIVVAILINFSLFFTKVVIDASNILAVTFYDAMVPGAFTSDDMLNGGLSSRLKKPLELGSIVDTTLDGKDTGVKLFEGRRLIIIGLLGSVFVIVASFVFFAMSLMLIIRFVVLMFVLILSPIAFMAFVLPGLKSAGEKWKDALFNQAFFAPIFFILIWIVVNIVDGILVGKGSLAVALGGVGGNEEEARVSAGSVVIIMNFIIIIVLLVSSLIIAKSLSDKAGGSVGKLNKWAMGKAGGASFGLLARGGRYTAGLGSEAFKSTGAYKRLEAASSTSASARLALATVDKTRKVAFDVRGSRLGGALSGAGLDVGQAKQGGFEAEFKGAREFLERPGTESRKQRLERSERAENELKVTAGTQKGANATQIETMEKAVAKMSDKEVETIVNSNRKLLKSQEFANAISVKQLETLNKSDKFSDVEKNDLKDTRFSKINTAMKPGGVGAANVSDEIKALKDSELEMINPEHFTDADFISQLRGPQFEAIYKSSKFTSRQQEAVKTLRKGSLRKALDVSNPTGYDPSSKNIDAALKKIRQMGGKDFVELMRQDIIPVPGASPIPLLLHPRVLPVLKPNMLKKMTVEMNDTQIAQLRSALLKHGEKATKDWLNNPTTGGSEFA